MTPSLNKWISDADALYHMRYLGVGEALFDFTHIRSRSDDYYISLVGELFERMRDGYQDVNIWARLGNAFAQLASENERVNFRPAGVSKSDILFMSATAFYLGGFPASALLTMQDCLTEGFNDQQLACFELLSKPRVLRSVTGQTLIVALRSGDLTAVQALLTRANEYVREASMIGPAEWVTASLYSKLLEMFCRTNVRAILPSGQTDFWKPLVESLLARSPATIEFFPSQIQAIQMGLLENNDTFSLQMPTGAGKTTLCETLLFHHLKINTENTALFLVPYRSLASELRSSLVKNLNKMGIQSRCAYGGTIPSGDEVQALSETRAVVATPEALLGLLAVDNTFLNRISLVICDEGHLLDSGGRGIALELLLSRLKARESGSPKFVFISAIVPNIEEINAWLGGTPDTVIKSTYKPSIGEFGLLCATGANQATSVALRMHPQERAASYDISGFLTKSDFQYAQNGGRSKVFSFKSVKTQAIAAARKILPIGAVAVFATNKRGKQGAVGLAEELLSQLEHPLSLPAPIDFANNAALTEAHGYVSKEFGNDWIGSELLSHGAVLHHGDIPQECREIIEGLLRKGSVRLVICTSTLAEGVNLPIRTLVLYSVVRTDKVGTRTDLLARDIKNLIGRAGRAGINTKGLVICANEKQWPSVQRVASQDESEQVKGALYELLTRLSIGLVVNNVLLSNETLETAIPLYSLIDGIDATLIDLVTEEIGEQQLLQLASDLSEKTFAEARLTPENKTLLKSVFALRAAKIFALRESGQLQWIRDTGAKVRIITYVQDDLLQALPSWAEIVDTLHPAFVDAILGWSWRQKEFQSAISDAYRVEPANVDSVRNGFFEFVKLWLAGRRFVEIANELKMDLDTLLAVHTKIVCYDLQTLVEQGIAVLQKSLEAQGVALSQAVLDFSDCLRLGLSKPEARILYNGGVRHRRAAFHIGEVIGPVDDGDRQQIFLKAKETMQTHPDFWRAELGELVARNTLIDIDAVLNRVPEEG